MADMVTISEDDFLTRYRPLPNTLNDNASFDFGAGGCLYETYGAELEHIRRQQEGYVWTVIDGEDAPVITNGYHLVNRIGYILTEVSVGADDCIEVLLD